jgi:hypothetical protein
MNTKLDVRLALAACIAIVGFYGVLGLGVLAPESLYSGDIGVKYVQARALVDHRFTSLDIPYPGQVLDPERELTPLRPPFVLRTRGTTQAIFSPASAVLQALAVAPFGFHGFIAVSIVAAALVLAASVKLAPHGLALPVIVTVGLAGPLWFYAVSGWEHAPAVAFGTAAFAVALGSSRRTEWTAFIAGALCGAGATLRDEVVLLSPGLLLAIWLRERSWQPVLKAVGGIAIPLLAAAVIEVGWFGRPPVAHGRHAVHLLQTALNLTSLPNPDVPVLTPMTPRERYFTVVTYWLLGRGSDLQVASFVGAFALALFIRWRWRSSIAILGWLLAVGATVLPDVQELLAAPKWLAGLIRLCPYLVFAAVPLAARPGGGVEASTSPPSDSWIESRRLWIVTAFTTATFLVIAFAGVDTTGGKSLGPRLLLPLFPLLAASSVVSIASYLRSPGIVNRLVGLTGVALVALSIVIQVGAAIPAYRYRNADHASALQAAGEAAEQVIVADDMFTAQLLFPLYDRKIILLADTGDRGLRVGTRLADGRHGGAVLISRNLEPAISLAPLRIYRTEQRGRMVLQYWRQ